VHTAVKIEPEYKRGPVIHVVDASRAVGVASRLLGEQKGQFTAEIRADYERLRQQHAGKRAQTRLIPLAAAQQNGHKTNWSTYQPPTPNFIGVKVFHNYPMTQLRNHIDWTPFFKAWELAGKFPQILADPVVGETASNLYRDAQAMLDCIEQEQWLTANAVIGLFPANRVGDDIELYTDETRQELQTVVHTLRQQMEKPPGRPNLSLADFIAPKESGVRDYLGMFAVTTGIGLDEVVRRFEAAHDDYHSILLKALADRLAEAFTEHLHQRVRQEFWGYAAEETLDNEALIAEKYRGIRPAPGYPACPDHTEKGDLFRLLCPDQIGMSLTESYAMLPTAAVSGYYFSHPEAHYFGIGRIGKDQVADYAKRKGMGLETAETWLASNLGYEN
jgi:5-methyltetrahydrofolate--homocysteine methyltransferase